MVADRAHDHHISKSMASAFAGTDLAQWLSDRQIDTLTVIGYMTHNCGASTILHAAHAGLEVKFLVDVTDSVPHENSAGKANAEEIHRVFSVVIHSNFVAVATTDEWIGAVQANRAIQCDNVTRRTSGHVRRPSLYKPLDINYSGLHSAQANTCPGAKRRIT